MDTSTLLTLAQTILQVLDSSLMKEIGSLWSLSSQLAKIKDTMDTINAVLLDAEEDERQQVQRRNVDRVWLEKLKDAVYQADDLFEEIAYVAQHKQLISGHKLSKEVRLFFSRFNRLSFAYKASGEVKKIRELLDDIAKNHRDFGSRALVSSEGRIVTKRRDDSHSFVNVEGVIGRDKDKKAIIDMLLDSGVQEDISFLTIVGIGGLGKTTLAQLVYNDERIKSEFLDMKLWVCVSDEFDIKTLLCKLLKSATHKSHEDLEMDQLQCLIQNKIQGKKYLLVLDDVWNEDRDQWLKLRELLIRGKRGSRVILTTRSDKVARIAGNGPAYELQGLSETDSWQLFEKMAFENEEAKKDVHLIEIGKHILKKCANVPLAIRVIGSLLYGQGRRTWLSFKNTDLAKIKQDEKNGIVPILKLSYHHLEPPLKSCFSYYAVFPKDYRIDKQCLISLWMAHGFIVPLEDQSVEDAGEEYFLTLLQRCFFQDVERDDYGEILSCKVHDLMHDVAQEVAGKDITVVSSAASKLDDKTRHLSFGNIKVRSLVSSLGQMESIRTFFRLEQMEKSLSEMESNGDMRVLLSKARCLRVLCLCHSKIRTFPSTIDGLVHLRYLNLSYSEKLRVLPATITKLHNLQTLNLKGCRSLKELPRDFNRLTNSRELDISECRSLSHMPPRMSKLNCLHRLSKFVVGYPRNGTFAGQLEDLEALTNLRGSLEIAVERCLTSDVAKFKEARYVSGMEHLRGIKLSLNCHGGSTTLLEALQPHHNLRYLEVIGYEGTSFPNWESSDDLGTSLPNLVEFSLFLCRRMQNLPLLGRLQYLKTLFLQNLDSMEYIESGGSGESGIAAVSTSVLSSSVSADDQSALLPFLEKLHLIDMPTLKGWRRFHSSLGVDDSNGRRGEQQLLLSLSAWPAHSFPRLLDLEIRNCPELTSIPISSNMERMTLCRENKVTSVAPWMLSSNVNDPHKRSAASPSLFTSCCWSGSNELTFEFSRDMKLMSLSRFEELFQSRLSSSLCSLTIWELRNLKSLQGGGLEHLTSLQDLRLFGLDNLEEMDDGQDNHNLMPWRALVNLRNLQLCRLPRFTCLPQGIQHLSNLQSLLIRECYRLQVLPEWISCLTSLQSLDVYGCYKLKSLPYEMIKLTSLTTLEIRDCPGLIERCRESTGEDWPKIQHIPSVTIQSSSSGEFAI